MAVQIDGSQGKVIATSGDYSGGVSIGGTLTYEDVTNIDAVGLITARNGIEIGARPGVAASISVDGNMIISGISTFGGAISVGGDITATSNLSGLPTRGADYWTRMRGGIMTGAFASFIAALVSTFPSTTFSQNNGVIRLTGVASRHVGNYVAVFLVLLGLVPVIAGFFQAIPVVVVYGATLLMFLLVVVSGIRVVQDNQPGQRDYLVVGLAIVMGYGVASYIELLPGLHAELLTIFQFPVSTGAVLAILLEFIVPGRARDAGASA